MSEIQKRVLWWMDAGVLGAIHTVQGWVWPCQIRESEEIAREALRSIEPDCPFLRDVG